MLQSIRSVDNFVIEQFDKAVKFLHDWLFISQKWLERGVMIFCLLDVGLLLKAHHTLGWEIFADVILFIGMWVEYREPKTARTLRRATGVFGRVYWLFLCLFFGAANILSNYLGTENGNRYIYLYDTLTPLWCVARVLMSYITVLDVDGERGKAAKLSWQKLKELFGVEWVPQPQRG